VIFDTGGSAAVSVAVIDGPYDVLALSGILEQTPVSFGSSSCGINPHGACSHGTFIIGLLGARRDALVPGLCPGCRLLHVPLFLDENAPWASVAALAHAIMVAITAGARLINLSLAILGDDAENYRDLTVALDSAEASGAVVVVAAGNQGHLTMGQLLMHPATIPVVAVDARGSLLRDCNFGPSIWRRGVAALGQQVLGYAPGGGTTVMSGTSVATAVATGTLALLWSARANATGAEVRAAVGRLAPRNSPTPPMLDKDVFFAELDRSDAAAVTAHSLAKHGMTNYASLQGTTIMKHGNGLQASLNRGAGPALTSGHAVTPAQGVGGCACGAPGGVCTCTDSESLSRFIYVLGSVDIKFPDQSISEELQRVANGLADKHEDETLRASGTDEPLRSWQFRVLSHREARYVARQVSWILNIEGQPAYYLTLRDLNDLGDLTSCLGRPDQTKFKIKSEGDEYIENIDLELFVGSSSLIPVETCPGVAAPVLVVDQFCSFNEADLCAWFTPLPEGSRRKRPGGSEQPDHNELRKLLYKLGQCADNLGDTDEWRALNFLAVSYPPLYRRYAKMVLIDKEWCLDSVKVVTSRLWREKHIVDPVFAFQNKNTGVVQKYYVRLDVTHLFPMVVHHIAEYFDR